MKIKSLIAIAALSIGSAVAAHADPINGTINIDGGASITQTPGSIDFANTASVLGAPYTTGSFSEFANTSVQMYGLDYSNFVNPTEIFSETVGSDSLEFDLTQITYISSDDSILNGTGVITLDGDTTDGTFQFTTQAGHAQASFSATTTAISPGSTGTPAVPEPASLALFGTGLMGIVGIARRRLTV